MKILSLVAVLWTAVSFGLINCDLEPTFISPVDGESYYAYQPIEINVQYTSSISNLRLIQICSTITTISYISTDNNPDTSYPPGNYIGPCTFTLSSLDGSIDYSSVTVSILPIPVFFSEPKKLIYTHDDSMQIIVNPSVSLDSPASIPQFNVLISCLNSMSMETKVSLSFSYSTNFDPEIYGNCTLSIPDQAFTLAEVVDITVLYVLTFNNVPSNIYFGQLFSFSVDTSPQAPTYLTTKIQLYCDNNNVYEWPDDVKLNEPTALTAPSNVSSSSNCQLKTAPSPNYVQAISDTLSISPGTITIDYPQNGYSGDAGTSIPVAWSLNPLPSSTEIFTVTLSCPGLLNVTSPSAITSTDFKIPSDYYGFCSFSVSSINYVTQSPVSFTVLQSITLTSPVADATYLLTSPTINVIYVTTGNPEITGATVSAYFFCINVGAYNPLSVIVNPSPVDFPYILPSDSYGLCYINAFFASPSYLSAPYGPMPFYLKFVASFLNPPSTLYLNQNFNITISTDPMTTGSASAETITLGLYCGAGMTTLVKKFDPIVTNQVQTLQLDSSVQAGQCTLKPAEPSDVFTTDFSQVLTVEPLPIYLSLPSSQISYNQSGNFDLLFLSTVPDAVGTFQLKFKCVDYDNYLPSPCTLGAAYQEKIPSNAYGDCQLTVDDPYFVLQNSPISISIKYILTFSGVPSIIYIGDAFSFVMDISGTSPPLTLSSKFELYCNNGGSPVYQWPNSYDISLPIELTVPSTISPSSNCQLKTAPSPYYVQAVADVSVVNPSTNVIIIDSPVDGSLIAASSLTPVAWTLSPPSTSETFNVSLSCPNFATNETATTPDTSIDFIVPYNRYGYCQFSVSSANYVTQTPVNVTITQLVTLTSPIVNGTYLLTSPTINVTYITEGNPNITGTTVATTLTCLKASEPIKRVSFKVNPSPADYPYTYPSSFYGQCSLVVNSASANYLNYSTDPVNFYLKYNASFSNPPTIIYMNQTFNVTVVTNPATTGTASSETITLGLYCGGSMSNLVQTFNPILTNQVQTLQLDSSVQSGQCTLKPDLPSDVFTTDFSQVLTVAPLPIYYDEATVIEYIQPANFSLLIDSSVLGAVGSFDLLLTCPNLTTPVTLPYTLGQFYQAPVPSQAYGNCSVSLNNSYFSLNENPLNISIKYNLTFSNVPSIIYTGLPFSFNVNTAGSPPIDLTTQVQLFCAGNPVTDAWPNIVLLNQRTEFTVPSTVSPSSNCQLLTAPSSNFIQAISSTISVENPPPNAIVIFAPLNGSILAAGYIVYVAWTLYPPSTVEFFNVTLSCPNSPVNTTAQTTLNSVYFTVPSDSYGDCQFSVSATNYVTLAPVNVTITQNVALTSPEVNSTNLLTSPTINVTYVTADNTNITGATVSTTFACQNGISQQVNFNVNPSPADYPYTYPPAAYGPCSLTIDSASVNYLNYSTDPVNFYLKYIASFSNPPSVIYMNQTFNITIVTNPNISSPASYNTITLGLYCGTGMTTLVQTFRPIFTNIVETLQLDSSVQAGQCTLKPDLPSDVFTTDFSQVLTVAPLPIYYDEATVTEYIQPANFSLLIDSSVLGAVGSFNLLLTCPNLTTPITLPYTLGQFYQAPVPSQAYGNCSVSLNNSYFSLNENPLNISIKYNLTFSNVPSIIYTGLPFSFNVNTAGSPPSDLTTQVQLFCAGNLFPDAWADQVFLNQQTELTVPSLAAPNSNCQLSTFPSPNFVQAVSSTISVENVPLKFDLPIVSNYTNDQEISVLVVANGFPNIQTAVNVSFTCGCTVSDTFEVTTGITSPYTPTNAYGQCSFSVPTPPAGFSSPVPDVVYINWQLSITVNSKIYVGIPFEITVGPSTIPSSLATNTTVLLTCNSIQVETWSNVPFGVPTTLVTNTTLQPSQNCVFSTSTSNPYVLEASQNVALDELSLNFESPTENETITIFNPIPILVSTTPEIVPQPQVNVTAELECGTSVVTFVLPTNIESELSYDNSFYGPCSLSLIDYPQNFIGPANRSFYLKFGLSFVNPPVVIQVGEPFSIFLLTSAQPPAILGTISLSLVCDSVLIQIWNLVTLNVENVLQVSPNASQFVGMCVLRTPLNDDYFTTASTPVILESMKSPTGGKLYPITPEELAQFVDTLPTVPGIPLEPITFNF